MAARNREQIRGVLPPPYRHIGRLAVLEEGKKDGTPVRALFRNLISLRRNVVFLRSEVSGGLYSWGYMLMGLFMELLPAQCHAGIMHEPIMLMTKGTVREKKYRFSYFLWPQNGTFRRRS